jgi:hypothetical protein
MFTATVSFGDPLNFRLDVGCPIVLIAEVGGHDRLVGAFLVGRIRDGRQFGRRFLAPLQGNGKLGVNAHKAQSFADEITHCSKSSKRPSVIS